MMAYSCLAKFVEQVIVWRLFCLAAFLYKFIKLGCLSMETAAIEVVPGIAGLELVWF